MSVITAPVTNISRCSLHDGPGIRTVVYLKGCAMRCPWCHNPETRFAERQMLFLTDKCIGCGRCLAACPMHCHRDEAGAHVFDRTGCVACGKCAEVCPIGALSLSGEEMSVEQVMQTVRRDSHFYRRSGGGITVSGGECLLYPQFTAALLRTCRAEGIHTCIETALGVRREAVEQVMPYVDLFFCDCKLPTPEKHLAYTGMAQQPVLEHIRFLAQCGKQIILRIPIIPTVNDSTEDIDAFARLLPTLGVTRVELLRYNNLAQTKYEVAGMSYTAFAPDPQTPERMEQIRASLAAALPELQVYYVI